MACISATLADLKHTGDSRNTPKWKAQEAYELMGRHKKIERRREMERRRRRKRKRLKQKARERLSEKTESASE